MKNLLPFLFSLTFLISSNAQIVEIELFANGFSSPVDLQNAGDDRLFVVEQGGRIKILNANGTINATPFLNISTQVSTGSEQGLLGLAFHPNYAVNGYFYVNYTKTNGDTRISRFSVDGSDPDLADSSSELTILEFAQPFSNHNGGGVAFGPDGYLYIATGDGGSGGDPGNRAQNTTLLLGKLLRIDIDNPGGGNNYGIPVDNPFAGSINDAEEIWAYGLRNPWRISFDSVTGDIWIGDVGQGDVEEIDHAGPAEAGLNYGWRCYEGSNPFNTSGCPDPGDLTFPVTEYSSSSGSGNCSVTGGYVNRDPLSSENGYYFFADVCSGRIFTYDLTTDDMIDHGAFGGSWVAFGTDVDEKLYIVDHGGSIYSFQTTIIGTTDFDVAKVVMVPNPASENITINLGDTKISSIRIVDVKGSILQTEGNIESSEKTISVAHLAKGIYLVNIITESGNSVFKKLVVK